MPSLASLIGLVGFVASLILVLPACSDDASESDTGIVDSGGGADASSDAGRGLDAGSDAGFADATPDAGVADAAPTDAGLADADPADVAASDADLMDAGPTDQGSSGDAGPSDAATGPTGVLFGQVFSDPAYCLNEGVTVHEYGNASNSVLTTSNGNFQLRIPANVDVTVRVDGATSGSDCLSTLRLVTIPETGSTSILLFPVLSAQRIPTEFPLSYDPADAVLYFNFATSYATNYGTETVSVSSPSPGTGYRWDGAAFTAGTTLVAGGDRLKQIIHFSVDPSSGSASYAPAPSSGTPTCVDHFQYSTMPLAANTVSYADIDCN